MSALRRMTDDQIATERIKNAQKLSSIEKTMDEQLTKLKNGDAYLFFLFT